MNGKNFYLMISFVKGDRNLNVKVKNFFFFSLFCDNKLKEYDN